MDNFAGFRMSVEEITAEVVETARELKSQGEFKDVGELLQTHEKN